MEQTAVEWLYETLWKQTDFSLPNNILEKSKEMEKQQIMNAFEEGMFHNTSGLCPDEYYEETFKSE